MDFVPVAIAAIWVAITPSQMTLPTPVAFSNSPLGSVQPKSSPALPGHELCHVRHGFEFAFSLSCSERRSSDRISAGSSRSAVPEQSAELS
jgi:hypothetical protein